MSAFVVSLLVSLLPSAPANGGLDLTSTGYQRSEKPIGRLWRNPSRVLLPRDGQSGAIEGHFTGTFTDERGLIITSPGK